MNLENDLVVQCEVCGHVQLIEKDSLDMDSYSYERNMGEEIEYVFPVNVNVNIVEIE